MKDRAFAENERAFALLTDIPITAGHTLVCPKRVAVTDGELTKGEVLAMHELVLEVKSRPREVFGAKGFNCAWYEGDGYGQSGPHFAYTCCSSYSRR